MLNRDFRTWWKWAEKNVFSVSKKIINTIQELIDQEHSSFARWQRGVSGALLLIMVANVGLFSGVAHAQTQPKTYEALLDDFRDQSPQDLQEFGLVNVLAEQALLDDRGVSNSIQDYCERVQEVLGAVCMITPWEGETASRIVEALQQMYFEGIEVQGGLGKLIGLVVVGDVPLPVVNNGVETFPSMFPYTDLVEPAYIYDADRESFVSTGVAQPQAEVWHGLIRPAGDLEERKVSLQQYFEKNRSYYEGDEDYAVVKDEIGFHDQFWENDSFDNETKRWYLQKLEQLDRLMNYRYSGNWLAELSGEAVNRLAQLSSRTFEDAPVDLERTDGDDVNQDIGFNPVAVEQESGAIAGQALQDNQGVDPYGDGRLTETVPDVYSPGPIRNFLKDYVNVVARYVQGATELMDRAGRRQSSETLSALITKFDKYYASILYLVTQEFEKYLFEQAQEIALDFELVSEFEELNDFYTEEATDFLDDLEAEFLDKDLGPVGVKSEAKDNPLGYGSKIYTHFANGIDAALVQNAEHCSIKRGSNFSAEDGELGQVVSFNRKDNPLTSQDISEVDGIAADEEIELIYESFGYCSYIVRDQCVPSKSKRPLFDFAASEIVEGGYDFRSCFEGQGPQPPEDTDTSSFVSIPSAINHIQPTGGLVNAVLDGQLAHYLPIDAIRHASFYLGGGSQYAEENVGRLRYPSFFDIQSVSIEDILAEMEQMVSEKEEDLRRLRVQANWKRFAQYIAYSTAVPGRPDFWNYNEIDGFAGRFAEYQQDVLKVLRAELDPVELFEDYQLIELYLTGNQLSQEAEEQIRDLFTAHFPAALAKQDLNLDCRYGYDLPPVDINFDLPDSDESAALLPTGYLKAFAAPDFNPPSVSRFCDNEVAKSTVDEVKTLREFYFSRGGVRVDMTILHNSDKFVEVLDPVAVVLYFTPVPPPLPPNTNMLAAIALFDEQISKLEDGPQPVSRLTKIVEPLPLQGEGELQPLLEQYEALVAEANEWLNMSIEAKHKQGLNRLTEDKEMTYLVLNGDAEHIDFGFDGLEGSFEEEEDQGIASSGNVLEEIRDREQALAEQQEQARARRALEARVDGQKVSECGDSAPLLEWPGAVSCWLDEIISGPLIEPATGEEQQERSKSLAQMIGDSAGVLAVEQKVMSLEDRVRAFTQLPAEAELQWEGEGSVRVESARNGEATVIPERIGDGAVVLRYTLNGGQQTERVAVRVSGQRAFIRQVTTEDLVVGEDQTLEFVVELRNADEQLVQQNASLEIDVKDAGVLQVPQTVEVVNGEGTFFVGAGRRAKQTEFVVSSDQVAASQPMIVSTLAGAPAELRWDFADGIVGLDGVIDGKVMVYDQFGNPSRGDGIRYQLQWSDGLVVNDQKENQGSFFAIAGQSDLKVRLTEDYLREVSESSSLLGFGFGYNRDDLSAQLPFLNIVSVDGYDNIQLPEAQELDPSQDYRIRFEGVPDQVSVGDQFSVTVRAEGPRGGLPLLHSQVVLQSEFAGELNSQTLQFVGPEAEGEVSASATSGTLRLVVDDPNFGSLDQEVEVLGQNSASIALSESQYRDGALTFTVHGEDALGNMASLAGEVGRVTIIADGSEVLVEESVAIEDELWEGEFEFPQQPDRVRLELEVQGIGSSISQVLQLEQILSPEDIRQLGWNTPYMVLAGSAFGDYRQAGSVSEALLFGPDSKVQALTTELTPHYGLQQAAHIWPSGRVTVGQEMSVEALWENAQLSLVFTNPQREVGRLKYNWSQLPLEQVNADLQLFEWTANKGKGRVLLVADQAEFEQTGQQSGVLKSLTGEPLFELNRMQAQILDADIETEIFADAGDVLVVELSRRGQTLARLYVHMNSTQVVVDRVGPLQFSFAGESQNQYDLEYFYAGESTAEEVGLVLKQHGREVRYSVGKGRPALDDVRETNGQGFEDRDKMALSFLAGSSVGESTLLQSEGIINIGDPVISLRQARHEQSSGEAIPAIESSVSAARTDYSIGQLLYAPEDGEITEILELDVEGDGEDDLLLIVQTGNRFRVEYLEGQGEGQRWGEVSELLDLGENVQKVRATQQGSLVVLYESGQVVVQQNLEGKYQQQSLDTAVLRAGSKNIQDIEVRDFDNDNRDDLLFLTANREVWLWYGSRTLEGIQFGVSNDDRELLRVLSVRLQNEDNLKSAFWLYSDVTPSYEANCREDRFECQTKYFRGFEGVQDQSTEESVDRLEQLIQQSVTAELQAQEEVIPEASYLVRLDQLDAYRNSIQVDMVGLQEGAQLNAGQEIEMEVTLLPIRNEENFVLRFDLGADFDLKGRVECEGCDEELVLTKTPGTMWSLEGNLSSTTILRFTVQYVALPPFSFQVMQTNDDPYLDVGINVEENTSPQITVFESRGPRDYSEIIFGEAPSASSANSSDANELSELMRGIGLEDVSSEELKQKLLQQQSEIEATSSELLQNLHEDNNVDGYPDAYQENTSLTPASAATNTESDQLSSQSSRSSLFDWLDALIPQANAQAQNAQTFNTFPSSAFSNLDNLALMFDNIERDVQLIVNALKCSRGCLPLPLNFAFLAPGPINILGEPAGFDPGFPIFGVSPVPFFVSPALVPYQVTQFRIYISPTLTLGLGVGICLGQYLLGQCFVFSIPLGNTLGSESVCDAVKQGLGELMRGIQTTVGQVSQGIANAANSTGVIKASANQNAVSDAEGILGVSLGGAIHQRGVTPDDPKVFLNPIPGIFVDWWDRQWEEVVNSLTDLPDITVRLPDFGSTVDRDYFDKLSEKVSGETFYNLQQLYDLINSLPAIRLQADVIELQVPWIEPGILTKIEQSLYQFLYTFLLEFIAFLESFNLPCNITVVRQDLFSSLRERAEQRGISEETEQEIQKLFQQLEQEDVDLQQAEQELAQYSEAQGFAQATVALRRQYFAELQEKQDRVDQLQQRYDQVEAEIYKLQQPQQITEILPVFVDVMSQTFSFWGEQIEDFSAASVTDGIKRESSVALRSCVAQNIALDMSADVQPFIESIQENIEALERWEEFPRELAKYLNALEFYLQEVVELVDQLTAIVLDWWTEFERKLDLWIDVIFSYQELIALVSLIIDILKGYNKKCGLCTSDRLTLKELILKLVFGVIPKFPIIDFPNWPDVRLDFSDVQLGIDVSLPVFEVKTVDLRWPELPDITFPRFDDIAVNLDLEAGFSVALPEVPLLIPTPPNLPPLQPLPDLPQINLPNLPPAPEVPRVLESLLPIMEIIQTILDIWCLINKSLIPIDEKQLKTQIENLTNRSLNLILPIDVLLTFDLLPADLITNLVPFDVIDIKSQFRAEIGVDPLPGIEETIEQQFNEPINQLTQQVDVWIQALQNSLQQGTGAASGVLQNTLQQFNVGSINIGGSLDVNADLNSGSVNIEQDFPGLLNYLPGQKPDFYKELFENKKEGLVSYHEGFRSGLEQVQDAVHQLNRQQPQELMDQLAQLQADNVLVAGERSWLPYQLAQEKRDALMQPENFVEKKIALVNTEAIIAQGQQAGNDLEAIQNELLDTETLGVQHLGVAVVRNGEASRLQDYPLEDPVVNVWENDVLLAYDNALYLKSNDNEARRHQPYSGRVLQGSIENFQRSKVHLLDVKSTSAVSSRSDSATLEWSWNPSGVEDVELTLWDTVAGAQKLDLEHKRFYLNQPSEQQSYFSTTTAGITLQEGEQITANREIRLRFGLDQIIIPRGVLFTLPSLVVREVLFSGEGSVELQNFSGSEWTLDVGESVEVNVSGLVEMSIGSDQQITLPEFEKRPYVQRITGEVAGALKTRIEVASGERVPEGIYTPLRESVFVDEEKGLELVVAMGTTFKVRSQDNWTLQTGRGLLVVSDDLQFTQARQGMALLNDELLRGEYIVRDGERTIEVLAQQQVVWTQINGPRFQITLPTGNYYGRIRAQEGLRGFSPIVHAYAQQRLSEVQLIPGVETIDVPIYTPFEVDAADAVIGELPGQNYRWQINGSNEFIEGSVFRFPGFDQVGEQSLTLYIQDANENIRTKEYSIHVFVPELTIDPDLYEETRVIRVESDPALANIPIGIVGSRDGAQDWLLYQPEQGSRLGNRYFTDDRGIVQLQPLEELEGLNIIIDGNRNVARLYPNGRVVLHDEFRDTCQNEPLLDVDGYVKFRVSCAIDGELSQKFEVRMVPHIDTDVSIVEEFENSQTGVVIRSLQQALELVALPANSQFAAGGAQLRVAGGDVLMLISPEGQIEINQEDVAVVLKAEEDPTAAVVWQVVQAGALLAEFQILGPGENTSVIDPIDRDIVQGDEDGDGMLDRWELSYGVDDPDEDVDTDGLTNLEEFQAGTIPTQSDTDGDGLLDGEELDPVSDLSAVRNVSFNDVSEDSPYFQAIDELARLGFVQGYEDGTYRPDQLVTRAEAIKILMSVIRCENCEFPTQQTRDLLDPTQEGADYFVEFHDGIFDGLSSDPLKNFAFNRAELDAADDSIRTYLDVSVTDWFYYCIEIATQLGLVNGYRGFEGGVNALGSFLPQRNVNIAELMKMVIEAVGEKGKESDRVYGPNDGWWNDSSNNYLATAEEDLGLLLNTEDYQDPLRGATRAEVAYAAYRVLRENGVLDFDNDGVANQVDDCPCQPGRNLPSEPFQGCPAALDPRRQQRLFEGIEITQACDCLVLIDADLFTGSSFYAVITGSEDTDVLEQSNIVP